MRAFEEFGGMDSSFWAFIKYISETLGYTKRGSGRVKSYSSMEIRRLCREDNTTTNRSLINAAVKYSELRTNLLNDLAERI